MTDDDNIPTDDENNMAARDDNFAKSEREIGRAGFKLIQRFDIRHSKSLTELHKIIIEFGRIIRAGRDLYLGDDIGFGDWIKRHHLDTGKLGRDQRERNASMQLAILHDDGVTVDESDDAIPRKLDLVGCNNTTPSDIMKWARKFQRHLLPHLAPPNANKKGPKKPRKDKPGELPEDEVGDLGVGNDPLVDNLRAENARLRARVAELEAKLREAGIADDTASAESVIANATAPTEAVISDEPALGLSWTGSDATSWVGRSSESDLLYDAKRLSARGNKWDIIVYEPGATQGQKLNKKPYGSIGLAKEAAETDYAERVQS